MPAAKVALRPVSGLITPRQFGPMTRMPPRRAVGEDLALQLRALRADLLEAGRDDDRAADAGLGALAMIRPGTVAAGVTMTARSTGSGSTARLG